MTVYEEHRKTVALRWAEKRKNYKGADFENYARKTLSGYGWSASDVDKMMRIILKGGES